MQHQMITYKIGDVCVHGGTYVEDYLPLPVVHYPDHYGAFMAFAPDLVSPPRFCTCAIPLIQNHMRLRREKLQRIGQLDSSAFPRFASERSKGYQCDPLELFQFEDKACHRCNLKTPSLTWCHEMYGGRFKRQFGWYIQQTYYRLGVEPHGSFDYLSNICPPEIRKLIEDFVALRTVGIRLNREFEARQISFEPVRQANSLASKAQRLIERAIEDVTREEFGVKKIGESWVSESMLHQIVCGLFPGELIVRHHRPDWLRGLELDIHVPDRKVAFEYQGQQHFHPIKAWGGERALAELKNRDGLKMRLCQDNGIKLIHVNYTDPLSEAFVTSLL